MFIAPLGNNGLGADHKKHRFQQFLCSSVVPWEPVSLYFLYYSGFNSDSLRIYMWQKSLQSYWYRSFIRNPEFFAAYVNNATGIKTWIALALKSWLHLYEINEIYYLCLFRGFQSLFWGKLNYIFFTVRRTHIARHNFQSQVAYVVYSYYKIFQGAAYG